LFVAANLVSLASLRASRPRGAVFLIADAEVIGLAGKNAIRKPAKILDISYSCEIRPGGAKIGATFGPPGSCFLELIVHGAF
jgi:hypothetical protein